VQFFTNGLDTRSAASTSRRCQCPPCRHVDLKRAVNYTTNKITRVDPLPRFCRARDRLDEHSRSGDDVGMRKSARMARTLTAQYALVRSMPWGACRTTAFRVGAASFTTETYSAKTLAMSSWATSSATSICPSRAQFV